MNFRLAPNKEELAFSIEVRVKKQHFKKGINELIFAIARHRSIPNWKFKKWADYGWGLMKNLEDF